MSAQDVGGGGPFGGSGGCAPGRDSFETIFVTEPPAHHGSAPPQSPPKPRCSTRGRLRSAPGVHEDPFAFRGIRHMAQVERTRLFDDP